MINSWDCSRPDYNKAHILRRTEQHAPFRHSNSNWSRSVCFTAETAQSAELTILGNNIVLVKTDAYEVQFKNGVITHTP